MKNQNDMIISIVAIVLGLIGFCIGFFTKRQPSAAPSPETVVLTPPALQGAEVKMANSLPAGSAGPRFNSAGGGGGQAAGNPAATGFRPAQAGQGGGRRD